MYFCKTAPQKVRRQDFNMLHDICGKIPLILVSVNILFLCIIGKRISADALICIFTTKN